MKEKDLALLFSLALLWKIVRKLLLFILSFFCFVGSVIAALGNQWEKGIFLLLAMIIIDKYIDDIDEIRK